MSENLDFEGLKKVALEYIQKVSSKMWTDHNVHDPGITMLEQICFALVDLGFRTQFSVSDLLTKKGSHAPSLQNSMPEAHEILSSSPVTANDYKKMILENFREQVRNVHFFPKSRPITIDHRIFGDTTDRQEDVLGYYDCLVQLTKEFPANERAEIIANISKMLLQNRNLCECFGKVDVLENIEVGIIAQIELEREANHNAITHEIERRLFEYMSPSIPYYTYDQLVQKGKSCHEIFLGTLPLHGNGFIDHDDLATLSRRTTLFISDIKNLILSIEGVKSISHLRFAVDEEKKRMRVVVRKANKTLLALSDKITTNCLRRGIVTKTVVKGTELRAMPQNPLEREDFWLVVEPLLKKEGIPYSILEPDVIEDDNSLLLNNDSLAFGLRHITLDKNDISRLIYVINGIPFVIGTQLKYTPADWNTVGAYPETSKTVQLDIPEGEYREPDVFYSVQHQLTDNYKVGKAGIASSASPQRKAQRLQLKAYLAFVEQLLADYTAQLGNIGNLLSWNSENTVYFHHALTDSEINDVQKVLNNYPGYEDGIDKETLLAQKNALLNHLLARFNEAFVDYSMFRFLHNTGKKAEQFGFNLEETLRDKKEFLKNYANMSAKRSQGANILNYTTNSKWCVCAAEEKIMRRIGVNTRTVRPPLAPPIIDTEKPRKRPITKNVIHVNQLVFNGKKWEYIEQVMDGNISKDFSVAFGVRLIEHSLLVPKPCAHMTADNFLLLNTDDYECQFTSNGEHIASDPYSFQITAICPGWLEVTQNSYFRQVVEKVIREEIPAHISLKVCWLSQEAMLNVELCYNQYLAALNSADSNLIDTTLQGLVIACNAMKNVYPPSKVFEYNETLLSALSDEITQLNYSAIGDCSCNVMPQTLQMKTTSKTMRRGTTEKLEVKITPSNAFANLTWSSSNRNVATVSPQGEVTALALGNTRITASDNFGHSCHCILKVTLLR